MCAVTGTTGLRYHSTIEVGWTATWKASDGASGTIDAPLATSIAIDVTVTEIQTIGCR